MREIVPLPRKEFIGKFHWELDVSDSNLSSENPIVSNLLRLGVSLQLSLGVVFEARD